MNDTPHDNEKIESLLKELPLREPSRMLDERINKTLAPSAMPWRRLAYAACFGGVCFALGLFAGQTGSTPGPDTSPLREAVTEPPDEPAAPSTPAGVRFASDTTRIDQQWPVAQAQVLYDLGDGPPVRATIQDAIERTRWVDKENNRDIELTRPVREVSFTRDQAY